MPTDKSGLTTLYWVRNDLRVVDNQALVLASSAKTLLPVIILDPNMDSHSGWGFSRQGEHRKQFLLESLRDMNQALCALGSKLVVVRGNPAEVLRGLFEQHAIQHLIFEEEAGTEEIACEDSIADIAEAMGIKVTSIWGRTLVHVDDLPMPLDAIPFVFTDFRKQVEKNWKVRPSFDTPSTLPPLPDGCQHIGLNLDEEMQVSNGIQGGTKAGMERIQAYLFDRDLLKSYKETRNGLLGDWFSSKLSPWLSNGCLSPRMIYESVRKYEHSRGANESTYWLIFELLWRDFFRFTLFQHGSAMFQKSGLNGHPISSRHRQDWFEAWTQGMTGIPFIDANMRELLQTGFMSNRGRQNVAAFAVHYLHLDWRACAYWFERQLIDYDVASNWGNWAYVAGVGNDPRARFFNIVRQNKMYDPEASYIRHWIPEISTLATDQLIEPWKRADKDLAYATYPKTLIDLQAVIKQNSDV
jgi:deoxyribodipyrimidine photo-lyase